MSRHVLHVADCWDAGVRTAVESYVHASTSVGYVHSLLAATRFDAPFSSTASLNRMVRVHRSGWGFVLQAAPKLRQLSAHVDVVHAHSSFAGYLVAASRLGAPVRTVWTPHTLPHLRTDIGPVSKTGFRVAARMIAGRFDCLAAASAHERDALRGIVDDDRPVHLLRSGITVDTPACEGAISGQRVVSVGRLTASKGVERFAAVARQLGGLLEFEWIGDGSQQLRDELEASGVNVTGWLTREEVLRRVVGSFAFIATSSWETGINMAALEAMSLGRPVRMLKIPQVVADGGDDFVSETEAGLAGWLLDLSQSADYWHAQARQSRDFLKGRSTLGDAETWAKVYG